VRPTRTVSVHRPSPTLDLIDRDDLVRAAGIEPARGSPPYGFSYPYGFHRRSVRSVCGLDYPFTLARLRLRCRPSSLYTFRAARSRRKAWLGITTFEVSPNLSSSTSGVSPGALKVA
jgi:hypothetical protein